VSCATCHLQAKGFASPEKFSVGIEGRKGDRNAMGLANARWAAGGRFFWDERASSLEEQVLEPIKNPLEMGHDVATAVAAVGADPAYAPLFTRAFGDPKATEERVARAMAQFIRAMVSYRSRYDEALADAGSLLSDFRKFTPEENRGKAIFLGQADRSSRGNCATCHLRAFAFFNPADPVRQAAIFQVDQARTNGLDAEIVSGDNGVGDRTLNPRDFGRFRVPDLRNVELTAPYMHDGRFATLEDVVDFYSDAVQPHPNLDPQLIGGRPGQRNPRPRLMRLSEADKAALVAFLKTLTDHELARDPKFSDPFERKPQ
jgi:cytochrome c peroxidase